MYKFDEEDRIVVTATKEVRNGEELAVPYHHDPITLINRYGFVCDYGGCEKPDAEEAARWMEVTMDANRWSKQA